MGRIIVIGMGLMGPTIAKDCTTDPKILKVVGCDIDEGKLEAAKSLIRSKKFSTLKLDVNDSKALVNALRGFDVVVNASASKFSVAIVEAAIKSKVNFVDLSAGTFPMDGELYKRVEDAQITAGPGCGVDPGLIDILSGQGMNYMDQVEEVHFACGGLPKNPEPPIDYKIVFGGTKMPIRPGKVPVISDGKVVDVERYDDLEPIYIDGYDDMEAFYDGFPSSLLKLCVERGVKSFKCKTIRYNGFVDKLKFLLDLGVIGNTPIVYQGKEIVPVDFFHELIYPIVKFDEIAGDRDITVLLVRVIGTSGDVDIEVTYEMVDEYDEKKKITSMAKTTGYTGAIIARMVARGDVKEKGVQWPVRIIRGVLFEELLSSLRKRGVVINETITKSRDV
jgi:lysine 6-dehydrogenase